MFLLLLLSAQAQVPKRTIPPTVLAEVQELENRFELALAQDCDATRCSSRGCTYVDHAVADQGRARSLPGLTQEPGPGSEPSQEFLTRASCSYAHEAAMEPGDIQILNSRLQTRLSSGWVAVSVSNQALKPLPEYLRGPVKPEVIEAEEAPEQELPPAPTPSRADELWSALLPHFFWMVGIGLGTLAAMSLIWGWRRLGRLSPEDQALLAQLSEPEPEPSEPAPVAAVVEGDADQAWVDAQRGQWKQRLADAQDPLPQALVTELLRGEDRELLVQALLLFPELASAFPQSGDLADDKLELAARLRSAELGSLDQAAFFERLNRHALSAQLGAQADADTLRSLKQDFGAAGLAELIAQVPARIGGLLFALAPLPTQMEAARLLSAEQLQACAHQLLLSDRMDRDEAAWLFALLDAAKEGGMPQGPAPTRVRDQGPRFDAAGALSLLLPRLHPDARRALFEQVSQRFGGALPAWHSEILFSDLLFSLEDEARADLLLSVDVDALKAWIGALSADSREALVQTLPNTLKASLMGPAPELNPERVTAGRVAIARGLQRQLRRAGLSFEAAVLR